jgi:hypothetical protein
MSTIPTGPPDGHRPGSVPDRPTYPPFTAELVERTGIPAELPSLEAVSTNPRQDIYPTVPQFQTESPELAIPAVEKTEEPRLIWSVRVLFAISLVGPGLLLLIADSAASLGENDVLLGTLFGSMVAIRVVFIGFAAIGASGILVLDGAAWRTKLLAAAMILLSRSYLIEIDSTSISHWLFSDFGIDIDASVITAFASVLYIALPLIAWNLVRHRRQWVLRAAIGFSIVAGPLVDASNQLGVNNSGPEITRLSWVLVVPLGLLLMHYLAQPGKPAAPMPSAPSTTFETYPTEPQQPVNLHRPTAAATYPTPATTTPLPMTNTLAILSLIFSFVFAIVGVILGHVALNQLAQTGQQGRGLAIAGLTVGYISLFIGAIFTIRAIYLFSHLF